MPCNTSHSFLDGKSAMCLRLGPFPTTGECPSPTPGSIFHGPSCYDPLRWQTPWPSRAPLLQDIRAECITCERRMCTDTVRHTFVIRVQDDPSVPQLVGEGAQREQDRDNFLTHTGNPGRGRTAKMLTKLAKEVICLSLRAASCRISSAGGAVAVYHR